ncbi:uncharacterized protein TNCV_3561251 [Trichonephila clavipes]|nr:uncharacterized protein TNCV_3561251 [Trichonephila clavipes]
MIREWWSFDTASRNIPVCATDRRHTSSGFKVPSQYALNRQTGSSRAHQTALARFRSGHLRIMTLVQGVKFFFTLPCSLLASPAHLLDCWGISLRQLYEEQGLVCETTTRKGQMDLV